MGEQVTLSKDSVPYFVFPLICGVVQKGTKGPQGMSAIASSNWLCQAMAAVGFHCHMCFAHRLAPSLLSSSQDSSAAICGDYMQDAQYDWASMSNRLWPDLYGGSNVQHRGFQLIPVHGPDAVLKVSCHSNSIQLLPTRLICLYTHTTATLILQMMCMICLDWA